MYSKQEIATKSTGGGQILFVPFVANSSSLLQSQLLIPHQHPYRFIQASAPRFFTLGGGYPQHVVSLVRWREAREVFPRLLFTAKTTFHKLRNGGIFRYGWPR